ncbi:putative eka-like protein, partial [Golovinomyces cichoracearum]
ATNGFALKHPPSITESTFPYPLSITSDTSAEETSNRVQVDREILKPVPPLKRSVLPNVDHIENNNDDQCDHAHAYLLREIIDLIKLSEQREKQWQIRLAISTSVVSNIDSTLTSFSNEMSHNEAEATCGGPHRTDSLKCLARPTRAGIPTKEQLQAYRKAGDREYQAVVRANTAKAKAAAAEKNSNLSANT